MRSIAGLIALYEQGIYTFSEAVMAIVCEAATRHPGELARQLPERFLEGVEEAACSVPETATSDDIVIIKSSRAHAAQWFEGAVNWRRHFAERSSGSAVRSR